MRAQQLGSRLRDELRQTLENLASGEKEESVGTRETPDQDEGDCRYGESTQENTKQAFQPEFNCETRKSRNSSHRLVPSPLLDSCGPRRYYPIRETSLDRALEKLESGLCGWNADLNEETGESLEKTEKWERFTGSDHSGCFESVASRKVWNSWRDRCR